MVVMRVVMNLEQLLHEDPGGIGRYTARLSTQLPALFPTDGYAGFVARHRAEDVDAAMKRAGAGLAPSILPLPRPVLYDAWHLLGVPSLARLAPELAPADVVHAPSVAVPPRGAARLVVTVHDVATLVHPEAFPWRGRRFHAQGLKAAARRADLVIAVSQAAAAEVVACTEIPSERVRVVHNGVDLVDVVVPAVERARARHGLDRDRYILWVGVMQPRKNLSLLAEAFCTAVVRHGFPHLLVLAGSAGWLSEDLSAILRRHGLADRLRVLGPVDEADLHALYSDADLFTLPSLHEGFGLPALEAMAQGTAVLCTDTPALREVTGGAAALVPAEADVWAAAIGGLLDDEERRAGLGEAGRARAAQLSWDRCARRTHAVYEEAVEMPPR